MSVLIPVCNDTVGLEATLQSLAKVKAPNIDIETIICNDGGGKAISNIADRYGCLEARLEKNKGSYAARNAGLAIASGQFIAFLDADQRVDMGWIAEGLKALKNADYVGGRVVLETGNNPGIWERYDQLYAFPVEHYLRTHKFAPTANLFVRRSVFEDVGHFEASLRSGGDGEFGRRVHMAGFVQHYAGDAKTFHDVRTWRQQLRKLRRVGTGAAELRLRIYGERPSALIHSSFNVVVIKLNHIVRAIIKHVLVNKNSETVDAFYFRLLEHFHAGMFAFWNLVWAVKWIQRHYRNP